MNESFASIEDHIVILGWSSRVRRIIAELRNEEHRGSNDLKPILLIIPEHDPSIEIPYERVYIVYGRVNDPAVLKRANLDRASALLIPTALGDTSALDGESIFSLLSALTVNPKIRACVEIAQADNSETLEQIRMKNLTTGEIEIVSFELIAERLLAQAAINRGVTRVYNHLLSFTEDTNEIYVTELSPKWIGKRFRDLAAEGFEQGIILIGYESDGTLAMNPENRDYVLQARDLVWFIALNKTTGLKVTFPESILP